MELNYKPAGPEDIEPLFALNRDLIDRYEDVDSIEYDKVLAWVRRKLEKTISRYLVIYCDGEKAGYYSFYPSEGKEEIDDLYVFDRFRNRGIGTSVIKKCLAEAQGQVFFYVFTRNTRAVALYERLGFRTVEHVGTTRIIMQQDVTK